MFEKKSILKAGRAFPYLSSARGGEGLVFLAGALGGGETSARFAARVAGVRRVIVPAYPPVGSLAEMLDGLDAIVAEERVASTAVYGGSFGGLFAQAWVRRRPERCSHLILSGTGAPDAKLAAANRRWEWRVHWLPLGPMKRLLRLVLWAALRQVRQDRDLWKAELTQALAALSRADLASRYRVAADFNDSAFSSNDLAAWPGKVLILEGGADRIASRQHREALKALYPQARVHAFPGAGHAAALTQPEEWARVVAEFLGE